MLWVQFFRAGGTTSPVSLLSCGATTKTTFARASIAITGNDSTARWTCCCLRQPRCRLQRFFLAAVVLHRLQALSHLISVHVPLHPQSDLIHSHIPASITLSLQAVALLGVFVSMVLWVLVAVATPVTGMVSEMRDRVAPGTRDRLRKQAA